MRTKTIVIAVTRVLFGLVFLVFGLDGFLHFISQPSEPPPEGAMNLALAFLQSGYLFPLIKGTEVLGGVLVLSGRFAPLGLVLLAPVIVNIAAFHFFLAPDGAWLALVLVAIALALAWAHRDAYRPLLSARA